MIGVFGAIVLLGCLVVGGCMALIGFGVKKQIDEEQEVASGPALVVAADALHAEFDANEVAADAKYKGELLEVSGTVREIGKGVFGGQYVALAMEGRQFTTSARANFPASATEQLAKLTKGQQVTIRGKCNGFSIGTVQLVNCSIK